jgi:anti-anti-sigma regulatory factor
LSETSHIADPPPRLPPRPPSPETWERFRDDLFAFLDANKPKRLVLDFAGLDRIGRHHPIFSSAINSVYFAAKQRSAAFGCEWRLCGFTKESREFFNFLRLTRFFPHVHETQVEAVAAFKGAGK